MTAFISPSFITCEMVTPASPTIRIATKPTIILTISFITQLYHATNKGNRGNNFKKFRKSRSSWKTTSGEESSLHSAVGCSP